MSSIKAQVVEGLESLSETELAQVAEFMAFLKFRAQFQTMPQLEEAQLATLYTEFAEEDRKLAEEGIAEYAHGLYKEDAP